MDYFLAAVDRHGIPRWVLLRGQADNAFVVWEDGHVLRVDVRDLTAPKPVEEVDVLADAGLRVTAVAFLNAKNTLVVGDSTGGLQAWFRTPAPAVEHGDGARMAKAHDLGRGSAAVTALASSARTRLLAVGHQDGSLRVVQVTASREVASSRLQGGRPVDAVGMTPDDSLLLAWNGGLSASVLDAPHSEVSWRTLFGAVFYEGYSHPEHVWQSSSGSDDFEPKLGLWPLVFGTLKATCYTMLFALPLALMAAVYTSEFLRPEARAVAKPAIEMMASLPSVVLGFLAALVVAPVLERNAAGFLAACVLVPFFVLLAAHAWAFVPRTRRHAWTPLRPLLAALAMAIGILSADVAAPVMEGLLFGGDLHRWLDGKAGGAAGGWMLLLLPASATLVAVVGGRYGRARGAGRSAFASMLAFLGSTVAAVGFAAAASLLLEAGGFDLRGAMFGTYVQRNALVVGCMMAFAVVPVVYTIAEDALASIPANLRAGSLALGATPWQTAVRVVIPTATSGIFSAAMVGLGRAVGETMIVLMAAGNTPVLDWNAFNGFRTLSANIAVELPEAVRGGTHYRTLFLSAFTLFLLTFVLNTAAELVRMRFRKRAYQL